MKLKKSVAISENGFIFNAALGDSFSTNPIGAKILKSIQEGKTIPRILEELLDLYDIDKATCEKDINDFVGMLNTHNLLEP